MITRFIANSVAHVAHCGKLPQESPRWPKCRLPGPKSSGAYAQRSPDVALVDIGLPTMDGYELARRIRAHPGELIALQVIRRPSEDRDEHNRPASISIW